MIYLDNAATTFPKPACVYDALNHANRNLAFNAGRGSYLESSIASQLISDTRNKIGQIVGRPGDSVIFASSATEALNQIIYGLPLSGGDTVFVTPFEHNAVIRPLHMLEKSRGIHIELIPFDKETWELDLVSFQNMLAIAKPKAVFVSQISNVTGYLVPYQKIFELSAAYNAITILDASQGFGVLDIQIKDIDYIVFAGHKSLYASFGVGGFIIMKRDVLMPMKAGGTGSDSLNPNMADNGPNKFEAGSPNIVAIAGLNVAVDWVLKTNIQEKETNLTNYLVSVLSSLDNVHVYKPENQGLFGIVSIDVHNYSPEDVGSILYDEYGIAVRTGYHCSPYVHDLIGSLALGTVRISIGFFNSKDDANSLVKALATL